MNRKARGLTIIDVIAVAVVVVILVVVLLSASGRPRCGNGSQQLKDQTKVRGIVQAMALWAQNNGDRYPLPSLYDKDNTTVAELGAAKDTTANIYSILIFNGYIPAEICVSPAESNGMVEEDTDYQFEKPKAAVNPDKALWDPAFNADFTGEKPGNLSYANIQPFGPRISRWGNTSMATDAQLGNRGPEISEIRRRRDEYKTITKISDSNTLLIHGGRTTWEGNIAYADMHVNFEVSMIGENSQAWPHYDGSGGSTPDCFFYDEPDDANHTNVFMSIFTKAGPEAKDWTAIWD